MAEWRNDARVESFGVENEPNVDVGEAEVATAEEMVKRPIVEPVAVHTNEDQTGPSGATDQLKDQPDAALIDRFLGVMIFYAGTQSSALEQAQSNDFTKPR